jgi:putative flippase GtrA
VTRLGNGLLERARTRQGRRVVRYVLVSVITVVFGQVVLVVLYAGLGWRARAANLVAFVLASIPSYWLNRTWTWGKTGRSHLLKEVVPFWVITVVGLVLSTWVAGGAESVALRMSDSRAAQALVVSAMVVGSFGIVWVAKFVFFNLVLFGEGSRSPT